MRDRLVNPELLSYKKEGCEVYNSATMTLEEVLEVMEQAHAEQKMIVRLHTGDPCIYGAIREQMDRLDEKNIPYESCPGVSAFCGAAASPESGIYASECLTERGHYPYGRTDTGAGAGTYCFFCSASCNDGCVPQYRLTGGTFKGTDCRRRTQRIHRQPLYIRRPWPEEEKYICTVGTLAQTAKEHNITKTALMIIGDAVTHTNYDRSELYHPEFTTEFRKAKQ